ncbi:MAG: protein kinase, partial [Candidatus Sumerlaeaceae bacterium]|nr:protein kinase [Candidatus Sumerlaeaceae bacterium]
GLEGGALVIFESADCKLKAAESYAKAGLLAEAAQLYQEIQDYQQAYALYLKMGDYAKAAETVYLTGDVITAARHYEVVEKFDQAAELYEQINEVNAAAKCYAKAKNYIKAAQLFDQLGNIILAADCYEMAGAPKDAGLLFKRATQTELAITNFVSYLETNPNDKEIIFELGMLYYESDKLDDAIRMLQQLTDEESFRRSALKALGECFRKKQLYDVAIDRFNEALGDNKKPNKDNIDIYYCLGSTHEQTGNFNEAKDIFAKVLAIDYYYKDTLTRLETSQEMSAVMHKSQLANISQMKTQREMDLGGGETKMIGAAEQQDRYKIIKKLGQGGMGVVYLALDTKLNRNVAWKVLPAHLASNPELQMRLLREAQATARLMNQHIVAIFDIVTEPNECYITMEYVEGGALRQRLREGPKITIPEAIRYGQQMAEGLSVAHKSGIVHRDIKPENVMVASANDEIKVVDFGLARLGDDLPVTREGCIVGTPAYMAPEQIMAKGVDLRTDIYAFGAVMYEMVVGKPPFSGENILGQHIHKEPPVLIEAVPEVLPELSELVGQCLAKDKEQRPANCEEIMERLAAMRGTVY